MRADDEIRPIIDYKNRFYRLCWNITWVVFCRWTPKQLWWYRKFFLVLFGAKLGYKADVRASAKVWSPRNLEMGHNCLVAEKVDIYNVASIKIGDLVIVSQRTWLCTASHDYENIGFPLVCRPINIEKDVWVASEAFIGPGVVVREGSVVAARAVLVKSTERYGVYAGNPAVIVKKRCQ